MSSAPVTTRPHVAVVGGGIAGLAAALEVLDALPDAAVTVLEAGERTGGKLRSESVAGHRVDVGAESVLAVRPEAVDLMARVGGGDDVVAPATTSASVWSRGALYPMPRATLMGVPADPFSARGILTDDEVTRLADEQPWAGGAPSGDVSVGEYVSARLGPAVVDRLVEPLLGGVYAGHARRLSLQATMPVLWERAVRGESLLGGRPAAPSASDGSARPPFAGLVGGLGRLASLVEDALRARGALVRTGAVVRGLERVGDRWRLVVGSAAAPDAVEADAVVLAVPPAPAGRLLAGHAPEASRLLGEVETASTAVVTLAVHRAGLTDVTGSGVLVPPVEGRVVKASTFSFAKWAWVGALSRDVVHLRASVGRAGEHAALRRDDTELVGLARTEVGELLGRPLPPVVDHHVQRWGGALPQYAVGHVGRVAAVRRDVARLPGVEVAGASYDGVGIPAVIASATTAAHAVAHHLSTAASRGEAR
ncbi:protoporphyrinogen oxidase [Phycicoccus sp. CSK15P-2]|uniref:protoporphyrinogen oxidase n=1 Tax=Phycicoccus sp. CSK15P-2 TaxID=2807627 RepID=UPI00194FD8A8|nr:protoporphyrinogen oxidase [Phycicoccus sp. CSK15P-2]MBM6403963.1 protoporphyrinogen oxidase [Phycicoccus sp. CSK15P-2]